MSKDYQITELKARIYELELALKSVDYDVRNYLRGTDKVDNAMITAQSVTSVRSALKKE
jgi:hypothetical protein